jgi:nucleoside-diphosphate-sugar epimerase
MAKILVTGANGFVGTQIVRFLSKTDVKLIPLVRHGKEKKVENLPNLERIITTADLFQESESWWIQECQDVDTIIHAAWYAEPGQYLQAPQNIDCLIGSLRLAKGAAIAGVKRFIGIGTCFEYDLSQGVLSIETPLKPITPYASAKAALYFSLLQWFSLQSIDFAWCRLFYLYGEGEDKRRLVPYLRQQIEKGEPVNLTSGKQIRDFLDVSEAGRQIADVALGSQVGAINICSGTPITVRQLAEQIADEYGRRDLLRFGGRPDNLVDPPCILGIPNL